MEIWKLAVIAIVIICLLKIGIAYVTEDTISTVTGTIALTNGAGTTTLAYPQGFNKDNCVPIAVGIDISATGIFSYFAQSNCWFGAKLTASNITVNCSSDGVGSTSTKNVKVVLKKIPVSGGEE